MGNAAYLGGEFYIMGGEWFPGEHPDVSPEGVFDLVEIYNPRQNTWRRGTPMPQGLHGLFPVVYDEVLYVLGGGPAIDRGTSQVRCDAAMLPSPFPPLQVNMLLLPRSL
jgi:hypothetical protein